MKTQKPTLTLTVETRPDCEPNQAMITSNFENIEGDWGDIYVRFSGFFGHYGPEMFAAAPDLADALESLLKMPDYDGTPEVSRIRLKAKNKAKAALKRIGRKVTA